MGTRHSTFQERKYPVCKGTEPQGLAEPGGIGSKVTPRQTADRRRWGTASSPRPCAARPRHRGRAAPPSWAAARRRPCWRSRSHHRSYGKWPARQPGPPRQRRCPLPDRTVKCSQFPSCLDFAGLNGIQNCVLCCSFCLI